MAKGAFHPITLEDACPGGQGKLDFCRQEQLVKIEQIRVAPAGVLDVLPIAEVPSAMREGSAEWVLRATNPGRANVTLEGSFSDGSRRSATIAVSVAQTTRAEPVMRCLSGQDPIRFPAGESVRLQVRLFAGSAALAGAIPGALSGPGLASAPGLRMTAYSWQAPAGAGDVTFTSSMLPGFRLVLGSYQPADVAIEGGAIDHTRVPANSPLVVRMALSVRGSRPCAAVPLAVTTESPNVCTGPKGQSRWEEPATGNVVVRPVASGTCRLIVGVVGGKAQKEVEVAYELLP